MLRGVVEHQLDDKGRLTIPAKYRPSLSPACYLTRGWHGCLFCFPWEVWRDIENRLASIRISDMDGIAVQRFFCAGTETQLDEQGRLLIPPSLRREVGIEKDILIQGAGNRLEIWPLETWQQYRQAELSFDKIAEKAAALGI